MSDKVLLFIFCSLTSCMRKCIIFYELSECKNCPKGFQTVSSTQFSLGSTHDIYPAILNNGIVPQADIIKKKIQLNYNGEIQIRIFIVKMILLFPLGHSMHLCLMAAFSILIATIIPQCYHCSTKLQFLEF